MAAHHSPIRTIVVLDPEGHELGRAVSAFVPAVGDTIRCTLWVHDFEDTVDAAGEVVHREWNDGGIVTLTVEPL